MADKNTEAMLSADQYVYFWKTNEEHGWGSQWYPSEFTVGVVMSEGGEVEQVKFRSAEQWMMVQKALLFKDWTVAQEILEVTGVGQSDMALVKSLGRKVSGFEEEKWVEARERIVVEGNMHKFLQNEDIRKKLLATGDKKLVEASPPDRIWGVGFGAKNAYSQRERWGLNLLGKALEETRGRLLEGEGK